LVGPDGAAEAQRRRMAPLFQRQYACLIRREDVARDVPEERTDAALRTDSLDSDASSPQAAPSSEAASLPREPAPIAYEEPPVLESPEAAELLPYPVDELCQQGDAHLQRGEYAEAVNAYSEAVRLDPSCQPAFVNRGRAYRFQGEVAAALVDFN